MSRQARKKKPCYYYDNHDSVGANDKDDGQSDGCNNDDGELSEIESIDEEAVASKKRRKVKSLTKTSSHGLRQTKNEKPVNKKKKGILDYINS